MWGLYPYVTRRNSGASQAILEDASRPRSTVGGVPETDTRVAVAPHGGGRVRGVTASIRGPRHWHPSC